MKEREAMQGIQCEPQCFPSASAPSEWSALRSGRLRRNEERIGFGQVAEQMAADDDGVARTHHTRSGFVLENLHCALASDTRTKCTIASATISLREESSVIVHFLGPCTRASRLVESEDDVYYECVRCVDALAANAAGGKRKTCTLPLALALAAALLRTE